MLDLLIIGVGATLGIDLWAQLLKRGFGVPSLDYSLLGRWILHIPEGKVAHKKMSEVEPRPHERLVGWGAHYSIGIGFALLFGQLVSDRWMGQPTLLPALVFGIATVVVPFLTLQPAFGLGIAASKTPHPNRARLKSLMTHAVFGLGIYATAVALTWIE